MDGRRCFRQSQISAGCSYTATVRHSPTSISAESTHRNLIEDMRIGYAPGGCLRRWLTQLGYSLQSQRHAGLVTSAGYDAYTHRIVFPLEGNLYGRSLSVTAPPHRFLPAPRVAFTHGTKPGYIQR